jgi:hypothetical protein
MSEDRLRAIDTALLCISEARERAEEAARLARRDGDSALAGTLDDLDRRLHDLHGELMRAAYMPETGVSQLRLAG